MSHAVRFRTTDPARGDAVYEHRPTGPEGYRFIRTDGKPVTDADLDEVGRCDVCYPVKPVVLVDRRKTS